MGALDQLRRVPGRIREHPWITVAIAAGAVLVCAWIAWAIYVTGEHGAREGLGVLIAWPALLVAVGIVCLPFVGGYFLVQSLRTSDEVGATTEEKGSEPESDESESEPEPEAAAN